MTGDGWRASRWPHIGVAAARARGRITLVSGDPQIPVRIEHRYDSEPADVAALRRERALAGMRCGNAHRVPAVWATSQHLC